MNKTIAGLVLLILSSHSFAAVQSKAAAYKHEDISITGYLYWDDAVHGPRSVVLVIHEWWGLNDYAKKRAHAG